MRMIWWHLAFHGNGTRVRTAWSIFWEDWKAAWQKQRHAFSVFLGAESLATHCMRRRKRKRVLNRQLEWRMRLEVRGYTRRHCYLFLVVYYWLTTLTLNDIVRSHEKNYAPSQYSQNCSQHITHLVVGEGWSIYWGNDLRIPANDCRKIDIGNRTHSKTRGASSFLFHLGTISYPHDGRWLLLLFVRVWSWQCMYNMISSQKLYSRTDTITLFVSIGLSMQCTIRYRIVYCNGTKNISTRSLARYLST